MKIELGPPNAFDWPSSKDEAFDQLERRAGPAERKTLQKFLDQVAKAEADAYVVGKQPHVVQLPGPE
jgi:hypothetical protein